MVKRIFLSILLLGLLLAASLKEAAAYPQFLGNKVVCPVSGEVFNIKPDSKKADYQGKVYYFCCPDCVVLFKTNPKKYLQTVEKKEEDKKRDVFSCKHCGLMMSVTDPNQKCNVCKCNKTAAECKKR